MGAAEQRIGEMKRVLLRLEPDLADSRNDQRLASAVADLLLDLGGAARFQREHPQPLEAGVFAEASGVSARLTHRRARRQRSLHRSNRLQRASHGHQNLPRWLMFLGSAQGGILKTSTIDGAAPRCAQTSRTAALRSVSGGG